MVHQGSELKKKKSINPHPKIPDKTHYRDLVRQNEWLRSNLFDCAGNYLYCQSCVRSCFGVSADRLARQRHIKRQCLQHPIVDMSKADVIEKRVSEYVIMPDTVTTSFSKWWTPMAPETVLQVRFPHERHGNAGKPSNSAKTTVREDFLQFVDNNSQPNGRSADSSGPTFYFSPKFTTIQTPKPSVAQYEDRVARSVVGEFNRVQREQGKSECSNGSSHNWLKSFRPKTAICPHQEDYCDTCAKFKNLIHSKQTTINRVQQSAQASSEDIQKLSDELKQLRADHGDHRCKAQQSHDYYTEVSTRCSEEWNTIMSLEQKAVLTDEEKETLLGLKNRFTLVICADYQMTKLVPYWGLSAQPGSTYYLQKLNHDIFGIVNHGSASSMVYLFDERAGPKNTDHTISYLTDYISKLPEWIQRVHVFLDNTCSTNKNYYLMSWAFEMVQQQKLKFLRVSFLLAGHTKFSPDLLFSKVAQSYNRSDVFNTDELKDIISLYAEVIVDDGTIVGDWREVVSQKYSRLPGIQKLHDFIFVIHPVTSGVVVRVRELCYTGTFRLSTSHLLRGVDEHYNAFPDLQTQNYVTLAKTRALTESKMKHLHQMSRDFIPSERWLPFLSQ